MKAAFGVRLTADEVNLLAHMFERGVDLFEGEVESSQFARSIPAGV
jgi:hypothetical protein